MFGSYLSTSKTNTCYFLIWKASGERGGAKEKELMVKMHPYNKMSFLMDAHYRNNINSVLGRSVEKYECNLSF